MGITAIRALVFNPADKSRTAEISFTVDSGAGYSVVPATVLEALGIEPHTLEGFGFVLDPFRRELRPMPIRM